MINTAPPLRDWLTHRASTTPDRLALVAGGRRWSYAELDAEVARTARRLAGLGVGAGDRIAVLLHNGAAPVLQVHAALRLGAAVVPLNVRLSAAEIAWQIADARPRLIVVEQRTAPLLDALPLDAREPVIASVDRGGAAATGGIVLHEMPEHGIDLREWHDPTQVLAIVYTSGTTGSPKGAMLTVGNFWWGAIGSALNLGTHTDDCWLACLPLFHVGGLSILLRAAIYGITAVVHDGFDAAAVNRAIDAEGVTMVSVVAVMLQRMLDGHGDRPCPKTLRCVLLGGGPAPRPLLERCAAAGIPVVQTYGLTETASQLATLAPEDALRKLGSAGRPLYPNELRIDRATDGDDDAGEILVRGPVVMAGYHGQPAATARTIVDGWLHTGDVGRLDDEGYLYVLDRREDLIVSGGENVYPAEVEAALLAHPLVVEAAVIGIPDPDWGRRVVAVVRLGPAEGDVPGEEALRAHCRTRLAGYKVPRQIRFVTDPLPRTASGKLQRRLVRNATAGQGVRASEEV